MNIRESSEAQNMEAVSYVMIYKERVLGQQQFGKEL